MQIRSYKLWEQPEVPLNAYDSTIKVLKNLTSSYENLTWCYTGKCTEYPRSRIYERAYSKTLS
jgi:hypothetical protein